MKNTQKKQKELLTSKISRKQKKSENKTKCFPLKHTSNKNVHAILKNNSQVFADTGLQGKNVKVLKRDNANKLLMFLSAVSCVLVAAVICQFFILESEDPSNVLYNGTVINGVNVGGLSKLEAEQVVYNVFKEKSENFNLVLAYKGRVWEFTKDDFRVNSEIHTIIEEAQTRNELLNNYNAQTEKLTELKQEGASINVAFNYIFVGLDDKIEEIINQIEYAPVNSKIEFNSNNKNCFNISEHKNGLRVNKEQLYYDINEQFNKKNNLQIEIQTFEEEAEVTKADNELATQCIAEYTTYVADSTGNRKKNVIKALECFNGVVVSPGEEISFNEYTGPHTKQNGYKVATVIYNGQFVDGVGGGICQASTTLYNALLLADVEVLEVHKHTLPVKYVPLGLDAMVSEYVADLKFKNNSSHPIYIKTVCDSESVKVVLYGVKPEMEIKTRSETVATLPSLGDKVIYDVDKEYADKVLFKGEQYRLTYPREGYEAKAYVEYYCNGEKVSERLIRHETYKPQQGLIVEGVEEIVAGIDIINEGVNNEMNNMNTTVNNNDNNSFIPTNVCP